MITSLLLRYVNATSNGRFRRFGNICRSQNQGRADRLSRNVDKVTTIQIFVTSMKNEDLIYTTAVASSHAIEIMFVAL
jgi:hypothetical protein